LQLKILYHNAKCEVDGQRDIILLFDISLNNDIFHHDNCVKCGLKLFLHPYAI